MRVLLLLLVLFFTASCYNGSKTSMSKGRELQYPYIYGHKDDTLFKPEDSLKLYLDLPFESSLKLYSDTDTLNKTVDGLVHIGIFKVENHKFAVITDTAATSFYKYERGNYKKLFSANASLAFMIPPMKYKDYNNDGHTDVLYSVPSGGFYGDDDFLLFYDPKTKSLVYNKETPLINVSFKGNTVTRNTKFLEDTFLIKGFDLLLIENVEYLQGDDDNKKVVSKFAETGKLISVDTLVVEEDTVP